MKAQEIRDKFTNFFIKKEHEKVSSSSLIPNNDKTLLFANAGMNQFKDYFTGKEIPKNKRATTIQKCVRAGGKHNDLENVGLTARHHTFFEMLGNFSFGDYFKKDAIKFAWEFLTVELEINPDKLLITVHESDDEAEDIWHKDIGISKGRIFRKGDKDNFWEMGDIGPCGPCSEIFYDHGEKYSTPNFTPEKGQDILDDELRYVEIWNLVFMQYEKSKEGTKPLPSPSIDTGAGLERITSIMQGVYWNYDTDCFKPILDKIESLTKAKYSNDEDKSSMRIVADHIRSATMLITDGVIPSNEGRGYVLRRIIRRAVRHLKNLGSKGETFHKLVPSVFEVLGLEYPQNKNNISLAEKLLKLEEVKFLETLDQGLKYFNKAMQNSKNKIISGKDAFMLYDTYGFPLDLTEIVAEENSHKVDIKGFNDSMKVQKEQSKKSWKGGVNIDDKAFFKIKEKHGETIFTGYSQKDSESKLLHVEKIGDLYALIFDKTPFYGESGGQAGDSGNILEGDISICNIFDTQRPVEGLFVHFTKSADALEVGKKYKLKYNENLRELTARNHSATHLLQSALIEVLGDHVKQAGSSVGPKRLRFDFTHLQAMKKEEISKVEEIVNSKILENLCVSSKEMTMDNAIKEGALALFGEKYGEEVRVIKMDKFSTELCGGTHVTNTSEIGLFSIVSEASLSTGVRRIEALTSLEAIQRLNKRSNILSEIENTVKDKELKTISKVQNILTELKVKQKEIDQLKDQIESKNSVELFNGPEEIAKGVLFKSVEAPNGSDIRKLSDIFINKNPTGVLLIYTDINDKRSILLKCNKSNKKIHCSNILKESLPIIAGKGGGKPDMAQGSSDKVDMNDFIGSIKEKIINSIN